MLRQTLLSITALALPLIPFTYGQIPENFTTSFEPDTKLSIAFAGQTVQPGELLHRSGVLNPPVLFLESKGYKDISYTSIIIDIDAPSRANASVSPLAHYINTNNYKFPTACGGSPEVLFSSNANTTLEYFPPSPFAGTGPHRYIVLAYGQETGSSALTVVKGVPESSLDGRFNFDIESFAMENGLGAPVAGTWFRVQNETLSDATMSSGTGMAGTESSKECGHKSSY